MIIRFPKRRPQLLFLENAKYILLATLLIVIACYQWVDRPIVHYFSSTSAFTTAIAHQLNNLLSPSTNFFIWPLLFFLLKYGIKNEFWAKRCLNLVVAIPLSIAIVDILKALLGRARPDSPLYGFTFFASSNSFYSFPSAHACTIGAICGTLSCFYPRYSIPLSVAALILALSRVILLEHYLSDVIAGVVIGLIASQWTYKTMKST
ncbi:MAG: phosphatase PAP2 family protein [Chlamydiota bacterium]